MTESDSSASGSRTRPGMAARPSVRRSDRARFFIGPLAGLFLLASPGAVRSQQPDDPSADAARWISGRLEIEGTYDDNIMEYSSREIYELNNAVHPTKYVVTNSADAVGSIRLRLDLTPPISDPAFRTRLRFRVTDDAYRTNPVRTHHTWGIELNQKFYGRNYLLLRYTNLPDLYLRNLFYHRYRLLSRFPSHYDRAVITKNEYSAEIGRSLSGALRLALNYEFNKVEYPAAFTERDNRYHALTVETDYRATRALRVSLDYTYALRWADGRESFTDPAYDSLADISSQYHRIEVRGVYDAKRLLGVPLTFQASTAYERQGFLSGKTGDIYHYGRSDNYWKAAAEIGYDLTENVGFFVHYIWEQNRTNLGETGDAGSFQTHIIGTGAEFSF